MDETKRPMPTDSSLSSNGKDGDHQNMFQRVSPPLFQGRKLRILCCNSFFTLKFGELVGSCNYFTKATRPFLFSFKSLVMSLPYVIIKHSCSQTPTGM